MRVPGRVPGHNGRYTLMVLLLTGALALGTPAGGGAGSAGDQRAQPPQPPRPGCEEIRLLHPSDPPLQGDDVWELQLRLLQLGLYNGPLDGVYQEETVSAVRLAQTLASLPPDGVVDDEVWFALDRLGKPLLGYDSTSVASQSATKLPPPPEPIYLYVDLDKATLTVYSDGKPYKTYPVAIGKSKTASPIGDWKIVWKDRGWGGGFGTRWMGLNVPWGTYGIHGTNKPWSIGRRASAGCFRMFNRDVEELYEWIPHGSRVIVRGSMQPQLTRSEYGVGVSGKDVVFLQIALQKAGVLAQEADGRFGPATQKAVEELQAALRLPVTGRVTSDLLVLLGLKQAAGIP